MRISRFRELLLVDFSYRLPERDQELGTSCR